MRTSSLLFSSFAVSFLVACGGSVESSTDSSGTSSGDTSGTGAGGAATSSSTGTGAGGASSTTSSTSGTGGQGAGGGSACAGYIDLVEDNSAPKKLTSICQGSWGSSESTTAVGYSFSGGPFPGVQALEVAGCAGPGPKSQGIHLSASDAMNPGTYTKGTTFYTDTNGIDWGAANDPFKVTFTTIEAVGGVIEGTFSVIATHGGSAAHTVTGSFHVCRVQDELAP